jgi:nitroimidazol reductase NimA-like FMN-containing flavoprotein (pyridoxamine 5'-phosphate oxidase superfamily)
MDYVPSLSEPEIEEFLRNSKTILRLGTVDQKGEPMIHPVWYYFDAGRLYIITGKSTQKAQNIGRTSRVYFSIDTDSVPAKGVKGKARASVMKDPAKAQTIAEKLVMKYLGNLNDEAAKSFIRGIHSGNNIIIELVPSYYAAWDYGKVGRHIE